MTFPMYRRLLKTFSHDLKGTTVYSVIFQLVVYMLITLSVVFWNSEKTMNVYFTLSAAMAMLVVVLDNTKGKGENGIFSYISYTPLNTNGFVWYSYLNRLWFSPSLMLDLYIPSLIFYFAGNDILEIIKLVLRFHILIFAFIYIRMVFLFLKKRKIAWFFFRIGSILILTIFPFIRSADIVFNPFLVLDISCITIIAISFVTSNSLLRNILKFHKTAYPKFWLKIVNIVSKLLFFPAYGKNKEMNKILFKKTIRSKKVVDQYLYVIFFILLATNITSLLINRTDFEMMKSLSFLLPLAIFNRIIIKGTLIDGMKLEYLPLSERRSRALTDSFSLIGGLFIWTLSVLLFSITYDFTTLLLFKGLILFLTYFPICLLFTVIRPEKWHSQEERKKIESKSTKTSFLFFLILLPFSMFMEWLIQFSIILSIVIAIGVCIFYYYSTYAKPKNSSYDKVTGSALPES